MWSGSMAEVSQSLDGREVEARGNAKAGMLALFLLCSPANFVKTTTADSKEQFLGAEVSNSLRHSTLSLPPCRHSPPATPS